VEIELRLKIENLTCSWLTWMLSSSSCSSCKVVMRERVRVRSRVVIIMSRREQDGIEAEAPSIDRDDERLKRDEIRHSHEWSRCVCMVQALRA